jgi:hypothetical protein
MDLIGEFRGRNLFVFEAANSNELLISFPAIEQPFVCLLACDARRAPASEIGAVAEHLFRAGCVYICCWGPDCERVHDVFDEVEVDRFPDRPVVMSTWHDKETLSEAIWFAIFLAFPDDANADRCRAVVGVTIGSPQWHNEMRAAFTSPQIYRVKIGDAKKTRSNRL